MLSIEILYGSIWNTINEPESWFTVDYDIFKDDLNYFLICIFPICLKSVSREVVGRRIYIRKAKARATRLSFQISHSAAISSNHSIVEKYHFHHQHFWTKYYPQDEWSSSFTDIIFIT